jgi:hypothetical protein
MRSLAEQNGRISSVLADAVIEASNTSVREPHGSFQPLPVQRHAA